MSEFHTVPAFAIDEGVGDRLEVELTFDEKDFSKPLSVSFINTDTAEIISVPADLWQRVVASVARQWEQ